MVLAKKESGGKKLFTVRTVPTYIQDFYTILKVEVELALVLLTDRHPEVFLLVGLYKNLHPIC